MDILESKNLFNQAGLNFLFESWIGATFASIRFPDSEVRLPSGQWPDIEIDRNDVRGFEIVEALKPGRRRGEEYKSLPASWHYPVAKWHEAVDAIPIALADAISRKKNKNYGNKNFGLIIYLNVDMTFGLRNKEVMSAISHAKQSAGRDFSEIFVLFGQKVF